MAKRVDLTGREFGELVVLGPGESRPRVGHVGTMKMWLCRCVCGKTVQVETQNLKRRSPSCGCKKGEKISRALLIHAACSPETFPRRPSTGRCPRGVPTPEYATWARMKARCFRPRGHQEKCYAGVTICDRWLGPQGFPNFLADMGTKPSPLHSIDRIDNAKGYSPENCRWATDKEQSQNRRNVRWLTFGGQTLCAADWARELGLDPRMIYARLDAGLPLERVLSPERIAHKDRRRPRRAKAK